MFGSILEIVNNGALAIVTSDCTGTETSNDSANPASQAHGRDLHEQTRC